jgi:hypothetical protein
LRSLLAALALALGAPAFGQTPAPETITFEGLGTPIPYKPGDSVPTSARLKTVRLAGGGVMSFRTRGGAKYVALVSHFGTTGIAGVTRKGKLDLRFLDIRIRKSPGAAFDSFVAIQAGARIDTKGTTETTDDETFYDNPGSAQFQVYDLKGRLYPAGGSRITIFRSGGDPLNLVKDPYDLTTTSLDFERILIFGDLVYDDLVVSYGH